VLVVFGIDLEVQLCRHRSTAKELARVGQAATTWATVGLRGVSQ
jgi:hypothetical protein